MKSQPHQEFRQIIWSYFRRQARDLPWRHTLDPYAILISEVMLQQTQVDRVIPKYDAWLERFPTWSALAQASLHDVLGQWQGLGYNRRALHLHRCAQSVVTHFDGRLPQTQAMLRTLPGIGPYTGSAICAFAYNQPVVMIETNIRAVFLHHFWPNATNKTIDDKDIMPLIAATVSRRQPRRWYWALMDYGAYIKRTVGNTSRRSKHHVAQSTFAGSNRQLRGQIIALLTARKKIAYRKLLQEMVSDEARVQRILDQLQTEGLIVNQRQTISIP